MSFRHWLSNEVISARRTTKKIIASFFDQVSVSISGVLLYFILDNQGSGSDSRSGMGVLLLFLIWQIISATTFHIFGIYKTILRYSKYNEILTIIKSVILQMVLMGVIYIGLIRYGSVINYVYKIDPLLYLVCNQALLILMILWRVGCKNFIGIKDHQVEPKVILIYGAGRFGSLLHTLLAQERGYRVAGFLDDDSNLQGMKLDGKKIYSTSKLIEVIESNNQYQLLEIWIAIQNIEKNKISDLVALLKPYKVNIRRVPEFNYIKDQKLKLSQFREIEVEDLLGRSSVPPMHNLMKSDVQNKVILVTGAGGSIGSELCRQIICYKPKFLILLDISEYSLFSIERELSQRFCLETTVIPVIGSVGNIELLNTIFSEWRPSTVYHAAAYKHVDLVQKNILEGIRNNVFGTQTCLEVSIAFGVSDFVLISTDKAVSPKNIMGLTKRICEMMVIRASKNGDSNFSRSHNISTTVVRFGNVLGSSGSVVPIFKGQIENGGPVTVTDPNVTRYFMTIPEAAQLVIQANALSGSEGGLYMLDMGNPVRILDLAKKMIELYDKNSTIEICFTGLKTGEKMEEALLLDGNSVINTLHPKIKRIEDDITSYNFFDNRIIELKECVLGGNVNGAIKIMKSLAPESEIIL